MSVTTMVFEVKGMTCGHCVTAVSDEMSRLDGVETVEVDLGTGQVTVTSTAPLSAVEVAAAVDEAGYELVS
jgi:copper ion binding protein